MSKLRFMWRAESGASYWIMQGLANALKNLGHEFYFWDASQISAFKAFSDIEPDVVFLQNYTLDEGQIKCCNNRPNTKVVMKSGFFGDFNREYKDKFATGPFCEETHLNNTLRIKNVELIFGYGLEKEYILGDWLKYDKKLWGFLPAADPDVYHQVPSQPEYKSDIFFCGGYWEYKSQQLNWLLKLCYPIGQYNIKIGGNGIWPTCTYLGGVSNEEQLIYQSSATICPNLSEPHATDIPKGFEINERVFKLAACKSFVISDYVQNFTKIFNEDELILCKSCEEFKEKVDYFIKNPDERQPYIDKLHHKVMSHHTYANRVWDLLNHLTESHYFP